jgi:S1-C subfamily serine protease
LVNARGEVVGINAMIVGGDQSVSIAASVAMEFAKKAMAKSPSSSKRFHPTPNDVI